MKSTLLGQTLGALTNDEFNKLGEALVSPIFNNSRYSAKCILLHSFLREKKMGDDATLQEAFTALYPGKPFNRSLLDNVLAAFLEATRRFIAYEKWQQEEGEVGKQLYMASFYRERNLPNRHQQIMGAIKRAASTNPLPSKQDYLFHKEQFDFSLHFQEVQIQHGFELYLLAFSKHFLMQALEVNMLLQHHQQLTSFEYGHWSKFHELTIELAKGYDFFGSPALKLLHDAQSLIDLSASLEEFQAIRQLFEQSRKQIPSHLQVHLASMLRHYFTAKINRGNQEDNLKLLALYQEHLGAGYLHENGQIPMISLLNMVNLALKADQSIWANQVLEENRHCISGSETPAVIYQLGKAYCLFHEKRFDAAHVFLVSAFDEMIAFENRSHFKDLALNRMTRVLEIKILYELDPTSSLLCDKLNAFKMFMHRNRQQPENMKFIHNNFIDLLRQLAKPSTQTNSNAAKKLLTKISNPGFLVADRKWVSDKIQAVLDKVK